VTNPPQDSRDEIVARRLELLEREDELRRLLRRTRFTAPVWAAGVAFFLWLGWASGNWPPALLMASFAGVATGVNAELRRRRRADLREVERRMERLPPP
jgi:hypothetical protein